MRRIAVAAATAGALASTLPTAVAAAPIPWTDEPLSYTVVDQDLRDLLAEVASRLHMRVRVSDAVRARVRGRLPPAPPQEFLSRLASVYGFEWYYDGDTLWISSPSESQTRMMMLGSVPFGQVVTALDQLKVIDERWPLRSSEQAGVVVASGPPHYVTMIEQTLAALQQRRPAVAVFRGQTGRYGTGD